MPSKRLVERVPLSVRIFVHVGALLAAVVVPLLLLSLPGGVQRYAPFFFTPAFAFAAAIGMPIYFALRWKKKVNVVTAALGGFAAVAVPWGYMAWPSASGDVSIGGVQTVVHGAVMPAGWAFFAAVVLEYSVFGAIGGVVFWAVLKLAGELPRQHPRARARVVGAAALSFLALAAGGAILYAPTYTKDRSCHAKDMGAIGLGIDLNIQYSDWPVLRQLLREFAAAQQLSFRDLSEERPNEVRILSVDLCDDRRIRILVNEIRWARYGYKPQLTGRGIGVSVYHPRADTAWRALSLELIAELRTRWPGRVRFTDRDGRFLPTPPDLR